jgi:hypothetical protein
MLRDGRPHSPINLDNKVTHNAKPNSPNSQPLTSENKKKTSEISKNLQLPWKDSCNPKADSNIWKYHRKIQVLGEGPTICEPGECKLSPRLLTMVAPFTWNPEALEVHTRHGSWAGITQIAKFQNFFWEFSLSRAQRYWDKGKAVMGSADEDTSPDVALLLPPSG